MINRGVFALLLLAAVLLCSQALATPQIQHWRTENGLRVYYAYAPELPIIDIRLLFDAGSARDGVLAGLAALTTSLLDEGSGEWDADEIANRFEDIGALYSADVARDMSSVSLRSLGAEEILDSALETFVRVIGSPDFPERAFKRIKRLMRVALQSQAEEPESIAEKAFYRALYEDHPFAQPIDGTPQSIESIRRADVKAFYEKYFVARNGVLALVGDIDRTQAERIAQLIAEHLSAGEPAPPLPQVKPLRKGKVIHVPFPSKQAHVYIGQPGIRRGDPDYFTLYVGNHILGGSGFNSRLVKEVRVKRGLSYSVYSYFLPKLVEGPFEVVLQTRADQAQQAASLVRKTIAEFVEEGPDEDEFKASVKNITGGFPLRIDSNADIVAYLAIIGFYKLPLDYLDTFNANIRAVDREAIQETFERRLDVDQMVMVVVGGDSLEGADE